jgi:hypothetical protein
MLGKLIVVNKNRPKRKNFIYIPIHRPYPLGNPFIMRKDDERGAVIERYRNSFDQLYSTNKNFEKAVNEIIIYLLKGDNVALECYCVPKPCHGNVIKEKILEIIKKKYLNLLNEI